MAEPVDIILLSYNRLDYLAEMVEGIEQRTRWPYRLTIVDNASGPATRQWLREHSERFHRIVWNERNEHLAGFQRGIAATSGEQFVLSDADLLPSEPTADGCWLTRLVALADRHADFALLGVRLDSVSDARNALLEGAPLIDGEVLETVTGVWLNLIRRSALRVPYVSDGITCHALRRSGYRVGIAADIYATHLGDADPERHPDYLARKQAASGWRTAYPDYPELRDSAVPPTMLQLALAAPVLAALERHEIHPDETVEFPAPQAPLAAVVPEINACDPERLAVAGARAIAVLDPRDGELRLLERAFTLAGEWVVVLVSAAVPQAPSGWLLAGEYAGPDRVVLRLAALASRPRWRRRLLYSTSEHRAQWLELFRAACFGEDMPLRVYVFHRTAPLAPDAAGTVAARLPVVSARAPRPRHRRLGTLVTKARRLVQAEWNLARTRRGAR